MYSNDTDDNQRRIELLRFKNDSIADVHINKLNIEECQEKIKRYNLASSIRIVPEIFPELAQVVENVRQRLIPDYRVEAFVRNSCEFQAYCFPGFGKSISISLTSGLIQIYTIDELRFVIGHELGHHLLGHHVYPDVDLASNRVEELNILALKRSSEISADRIGFIAVMKKDSAYKSVLKLASGLPDQYIRFDLSAYLEQDRELRNLGGTDYGLLSSHPTCACRMRALLWFEMSDTYYRWENKNNSAPLPSDVLDERVAKDMAAVCGFRLTGINKKEIESAMFWGVFSLFVSDGCLSKSEQTLMKQLFGDRFSLESFDYLRENGAEGVINRFEKALQSVRIMNYDVRLSLYKDMEDMSKHAGGNREIHEQVLDRTMTQLGLHDV